ncbi:pectinesterase inhibitor-like [Benincasa hispida]|uniref:pectinesterase inhibitor-like n=1 Tax=Benincasa hispida TaxID=102211 RepID=UPI001900404F|nr:pectinesterase inhibitor-like [Benincasa hispida]
MTNSNSNLNRGISSSISVFIFCLLLSNVIPLDAGTTLSNNIKSSICLKTSNPSFCTNLLKSAGSTDLKALATYTLNLAHKNAGKSMTLAKSLAATTTNSQLKKRYLSCSENYDEAIGDIENAQKYLATGDFNGVNLATSGIMTTINDCQDSFEHPPRDHSLLPKKSKTLKDICSIILVISNLLPRGI